MKKKDYKYLLKYITNPNDWKEESLGFKIIYSETKGESISCMDNFIFHYLIIFGIGEEGIEIEYENE